MKWLLARIGLPKAIGVYVDEATITLSQIVATPLGPVEITRQSESFDDENFSETIGGLVGPLLGKRKFRRTPVSVGIPSRRVYFSTRPVHAATGDSSAHVLLREALRSANIPVHDMVVDADDLREGSEIAHALTISDGVSGFPNRLVRAPCRGTCGGRLLQKASGTRSRSSPVRWRFATGNRPARATARSCGASGRHRPRPPTSPRWRHPVPMPRRAWRRWARSQ